ncbi:DUF6446 family protein [Xinfangfangia sp. CPCC 101601]|uniref:DUF6446 family protein n=1 Tax=Pseudogemmobacter lacusdianii TaxID=3069608 RepID=A0ABU0VVT6_9RHOB|nr:DUF6446 family protein [Xinfangfangia sp. CPCC 101601]MDQ2065847.1 DUF6446 family protein [Xinfangfangia sp. CPCC 101601]
MSAGKIAAGSIVVSALAAAGLMYYLQVYAFYDEVAFEKGNEIRMVPIASGVPEPILVEGIKGIDGEASPLKFRACFTTPMSLPMLTETYQMYQGQPEPNFAPGWFDCFDAAQIGADLEAGTALAFLSEPTKSYGIDRVVAVYDDGRAFAWHQINACGKAHYDGKDLPADCPAPPAAAEGSN